MNSSMEYHHTLCVNFNPIICFSYNNISSKNKDNHYNSEKKKSILKFYSAHDTTEVSIFLSPIKNQGCRCATYQFKKKKKRHTMPLTSLLRIHNRS